MKQVMQVRLAAIVQINPPASIALENRSLVAYAPLSAVCAAEATVTPQFVLYGTFGRHVHYFQGGDLLMPIIASGLAGKKIAQVDAQYPAGVCSPELDVIRADEAAVHPRYLLHWLRQRGCAMLLPALRGTTIKRIGYEDLLKLEMPLPPLVQQALCAQLMDTALARRNVSARQLRNAEDTITAVWQQVMQKMRCDKVAGE